MTDPGELDRRITIQEDVGTQDAAGQPVPSWQNIATNPTVWAEVVPVGGSEIFAARQTGAETVKKFRIRYRGDVLRKMRVVYDADNYDIADVAEDRRFERRQFQIITATARVS